MRKYISILLLFAILFSLVACSSELITSTNGKTLETQKITTENDNEKSTSHFDEGYIYSKEVMQLLDSDIFLYQVTICGNEFLMYGVDQDHSPQIYVYNSVQNSLTKLHVGDEVTIEKIGASQTGVLPILTIDEDGTYGLLLYSGDELLKSLSLPMLEEYEDSIITDFTVLQNGYIVFTATEILFLDLDGNLVSNIGTYFRNAACIPNDNAGFIIAKSIVPSAGEIDPKTEIVLFDDHFKQTDSFMIASHYTGFFKDDKSKDTILVQDTSAIYRLNYITNTREALIDIVSSGMSTDNLICIQDGMYWSLDRGDIVIWTASEDSEVITLTLAAYKLDYTLEALIRSFNENSSSYKIKVEDYSKYDDSENVGVGLRRLRTDIISGFTPDIFALYGLPAEVYASKGILEDLTPYFSGKAEIQMSDFLPNVLDALSINDALYYITPSFSILTVCGDQSFVGCKGAWTPEDFFSIVQNIDPLKIFGPEMIQERFMFYVMLFNGDEYVDKEQAECHFTDSNFEQFLEFAAQLPSSLSEDSRLSNDWGRSYSGEQKLMCDWFGAGAISMVSYADTVYSGSAQFVGFPSSSSGTALVPSTLVGMSASSQQKDGVIDFIYFILRDAYQLDQTCISDFPVTQKAFEQKMNSWSAMYEEYLPILYAYNDGSIIEIEAKTPSEDARSCVNNLVNKATILSLQDEALFEIVIEEANAYFAGIISSKQAIERIQSKANIYISEQFG